MDFGIQKNPEDIYIPLIINKLLVQQNGDKARHVERYYPFVHKHSKTNSMSSNDTSKKRENYKSEYVKMKRALYDHTRSLRHYDCGFSISTMLSTTKEKPFSFKMQETLKGKYAKHEPNLNDIIKKTEKILQKTQEPSEKSEGKSASRYKLNSSKQKRVFPKMAIEIPTVRAQTIQPCPRKKKNSKMVDREITADYQNVF